MKQRKDGKIGCVFAKKGEATNVSFGEPVRVMKIKNIALTISILGFAVGFSDLQENIFFWMGRPIGAIAFVVFFIFVLLEKEYALLDEQERAKAGVLNTKTNSITVVKGSNRGTCSPALTTATSR